MRNRSIRYFTLAAVSLALTMTATAACRATPSPTAQGTLPIIATASETPSSPAAAPHTTGAPAPKRSTADCMGAVVHAVDAGANGPPKVAFCITVGGVIRLERLGPGMLQANDWDKVDCFYAAGIHQCRAVRTGTIRFTTSHEVGSRQITAEIAAAVSPPRPSPACTSEKFTLNATEGGLPWSALCVKVGSEMRVVNLGPEGFSITPPGKVSCHYEAAVRDCRFLEAATVTITVKVADWEPQTLIVVAIK